MLLTIVTENISCAFQSLWNSQVISAECFRARSGNMNFNILRQVFKYLL
jgi:hypothetical protein